MIETTIVSLHTVVQPDVPVAVVAGHDRCIVRVLMTRRSKAV
jgi:hypothetical protein